jgi:DNA-binding NarL/FixJ family response regulator
MITLCLVEDTPEIHTNIVSLIKGQQGMLLLGSFYNGEEAIPFIQQEQPDIVIMDINLPGINGIECIRLLSDRCPTTQFMIFTIYENDEKVFDALAAGANAYILKKNVDDKLVAAIMELYAGGAPMSMSIARKVLATFNKKNNTLDVLTKKENEILLLLSKGFLYKEIASQLGISVGTVTQHIHNIYSKLHVSNRTEAINKFLDSR